MKITVTQDDIVNGTPKSSEHCPLALSGKRAFPNTTSIWTNKMELVVNYGDQFMTFQLPAEAQEFLEKLDSGQPVSPFEFELN